MDKSVQAIVTSPPFWNLRSYGGQMSLWGGDPLCDHDFTERHVDREMFQESRGPVGGRSAPHTTIHKASIVTASCSRCACWRGELGSENDVGSFIRHLVEVLAECKRVLRDDGVCMVNIADSYSGSGKGPTGKNGLGDQGKRQGFHDQRSAGRPKSLALVPERLAIALSDDGWIVRSRIAWCKAAPMPESVRDRPTSAWEHIWVLTKQAKYFWDADAVRQPHSDVNHPVVNGKFLDPKAAGGISKPDYVPHTQGWNEGGMKQKNREYNPAGRNLWNYWVLGPESYAGAHFATFPKEIPRRCILAATSEYGACAACGAPWARVTERGYAKTPKACRANTYGGRDVDAAAANDRGAKMSRDGYVKGLVRSDTTTGWTPTCKCGPAAGVRPCVVLDPFSGSGTSAYVAASLGRTGIGVELSQTYCEQARYGRLAQDFLPFDAPAPAPAMTRLPLDARAEEAE